MIEKRQQLLIYFRRKLWELTVILLRTLMVSKMNKKERKRKMDNPIIQIRDSGDGHYSIVARIWNPQKQFFEHPALINLTKEEAQKHCAMLIENKPTIEEIEQTWVYIGN